jgi:hypothetical protein
MDVQGGHQGEGPLLVQTQLLKCGEGILVYGSLGAKHGVVFFNLPASISQGGYELLVLCLFFFQFLFPVEI